MEATDTLGSAAARLPGVTRARHAEARILVVDDEPANLELVRAVLEPTGYRSVRSTADPFEALGLCLAEPPDLLILDLRMPGLSGAELLERLREGLPDFSLRPCLVLTSEHFREAKRRALGTGARDFLTKPVSPTELRLRVANLLETRFLHLALQRQNDLLEAAVRARTAELEEARLEILERLALAAEWRDDDTGEHIRRVGRLAADLARRVDLDADEVELIGRAAPLHDVGKIGIHDAILLKPGPLDAGELEAMRAHTTIGGEILSRSRFPSLRAAEEIARHHHENWDGSGYPMGLAGETIPLRARIVAIADVFDSLTHERVYKAAWTSDAALAEIRSAAGRKLDPRLTELFVSHACPRSRA